MWQQDGSLHLPKEKWTLQKWWTTSALPPWGRRRCRWKSQVETFNGGQKHVNFLYRHYGNSPTFRFWVHLSGIRCWRGKPDIFWLTTFERLCNALLYNNLGNRKSDLKFEQEARRVSEFLTIIKRWESARKTNWCILILSLRTGDGGQLDALERLTGRHFWLPADRRTDPSDAGQGLLLDRGSPLLRNRNPRIPRKHRVWIRPQQKRWEKVKELETKCASIKLFCGTKAKRLGKQQSCQTRCLLWDSRIWGSGFQHLNKGAPFFLATKTFLPQLKVSLTFTLMNWARVLCCTLGFVWASSLGSAPAKSSVGCISR